MKVLSLSRTPFLALLVDTVLSTIAATVWLTEDGVPRCAPLPSSNLMPFGRCGGTREAGNTDAESLVVLYRVGTHQIRRRRRAARSSASQGRAESLCTRIKGANREASKGKATMSYYVFFLPTKTTTSGERARFVGLVQGCTEL